uniref:hypothetical protein n=1 Tax=Nodularia spumigena TaxID=70799 RepID=UPI0000EA9A8C
MVNFLEFKSKSKQVFNASSRCVTHLTTELSRGSGIAAQRIHKALVQKNIPSQLLSRKGTTFLPHSSRDNRYSSILW